MVILVIVTILMGKYQFLWETLSEWLVNRSGDIRLKAYNETNDRYYTRTNLTTQGIGIIFKRISTNGVNSFSGTDGNSTG